MIISVFGGTVVEPGAEEEVRVGEELEAILRAMPGSTSSKGYRAEDGEEISILRMATREALDPWVRGTARSRGPPPGSTNDPGSRAETYREATWENGARTDGDLRHVFVEP